MGLKEKLESKGQTNIGQPKETNNTFKEDKTRELEALISEYAGPEIRVALIDDGVDSLYYSLNENIARGDTWFERKDAQDLHPSYHQSSGGYGTQMTRLIRRVCPDIRLYVAKIDEIHVTKSPRAFTAKSVVEVSHCL